MLYWIIGGVVWVACGVLVYGHNLAYNQREYDLIAQQNIQSDKRWAFFFSLFGPIALFAGAILDHRRHGLMYRVRKEK